jgi:tRNA(Ile)-lysidine synthase
MALLHLLARWIRRPAQALVTAATIDHGLRSEAAAEAELVAGAAERLGLPHRILRWTGPKPGTGLQEAARDARYALLVALAQEIGASHLVTAHTLDDQAETVLIRLAHGSGLAGLAGMRRTTDRSGIVHLRPLLDIRKTTLVALCRSQGWPFVDDPSNRDDRFARARWRKLMPLLEAEGLTAERLGRLADRAARTDDALDEAAAEILRQVSLTDDGRTSVPAEVLLREPFEIALRVLAGALAPHRDSAPHLRLQRLESALEKLRAALRDGRSLTLTLGGVVLRLSRTGELRMETEPTRRRGRCPQVL